MNGREVDLTPASREKSHGALIRPELTAFPGTEDYSTLRRRG